MGPLDGIKVIDISTIVSGPLAASMLGDQGAEVIKIEHPIKGENARDHGPIKGDTGAIFAAVNRSKKSLALDLKKESSKEIIYKLIEETDVIIDNFRPGTLKRLGLDYENLKKHNTKIIQISITGYGESGPYSKRRVYDPLIQATAGITDAQAYEGEPHFMKTLLCDKVTSLTAAQAITSALYAREKNSVGQRITLSMIDAALYFMWCDSMYNFTWLGDDWSPIPNIADFYKPAKTKDGYVTIVSVNEGEFEGAIKAINREDLLMDERFSTTENRFKNSVEMQRILSEEYSKFTSEDLIKRMENNDVPVARLNTREEVLTDPQVLNNKSIIKISSNGKEVMQGPKAPAYFLGTKCEKPFFMPLLGEHSAEILKELGFSEDEINDFIDENVIRGEKFD